MNPLGWHVGDTVEITKNQGLDDLVNRKMVQIIKDDEETKESPIFKCLVCGKVFTVKVALLGHQRTHKKEEVK